MDFAFGSGGGGRPTDSEPRNSPRDVLPSNRSQL